MNLTSYDYKILSEMASDIYSNTHFISLLSESTNTRPLLVYLMLEDSTKLDLSKYSGRAIKKIYDLIKRAKNSDSELTFSKSLSTAFAIASSSVKDPDEYKKIVKQILDIAEKRKQEGKPLLLNKKARNTVNEVGYTIWKLKRYYSKDFKRDVLELGRKLLSDMKQGKLDLRLGLSMLYSLILRGLPNTRMTNFLKPIATKIAAISSSRVLSSVIDWFTYKLTGKGV